MYGQALAIADPPLEDVAWLAQLAGHGRTAPAGQVRGRDGRWIDLSAAARAVLERMSDPVAKPAALAELLELHAADQAAVGWRAADDDWPG
jgi:hypothetical protein